MSNKINDYKNQSLIIFYCILIIILCYCLIIIYDKTYKKYKIYKEFFSSSNSKRSKMMKIYKSDDILDPDEDPGDNINDPDSTNGYELD